MNNFDTNYSIEDTGALMTSSGKGKRTMRIVLISVAILSVLIISIVGIKLLGDKKYNDQIIIAEKALQEGDYEQAEVEYLVAVNMKKKEPEARQGLAYSYVANGKLDKAAEEYTTLYEITNEEQYKTAAIDASEGRIPMIAGIAPSDRLWIQTNNSYIEDSEGMVMLLNHFTSVMTSISRYDKSDNTIEFSYYNSDNPSESYAFPATLWFMEDFFPEYTYTIEDRRDKNDPRKWSDFSYYKVGKKELEEAYSKLFNVKLDRIGEVVSAVESRGMLYCEGDYYYIFYIPRGGYQTESIINQAWINGDRCCIEYDLFFVDWEVSNVGDREYADTYYAIMTRKDGMWTLLYNGSERPKELQQKTSDTESADEENLEDADYLFADLEQLEFYDIYSYGQSIIINQDGSFGGYQEWGKLDEKGPGYENGTCYISSYSGKLTEPKKVSAYEYMMTVNNIHLRPDLGALGTEEIMDGGRTIVAEPYGIYDAKALYVYAPGIKISNLPQKVLDDLNKSYIDKNSFSNETTFYIIHDKDSGLSWYGAEVQ